MTKALERPTNNTRLDRLATVRIEMARIYRKAKARKLDAGEASKLVYILREIRCCIEAEVIERLEQRMLWIQEQTQARITGHVNNRL